MTRSRDQQTEARLNRDLVRFKQRSDSGQFWHAVALIGSVGWPIVVLSTGFAMLGHHLDAQQHSGVRYTLILLLCGTGLGVFSAYRSLRGKR